jgi:hypothetical protein
MKKLLLGIITMLTLQFGIAQNVGIGTTNPTAKLHVSGNVKIDSAYTLELGAGLASKEPSAGKIGYATFTPATLDIVGAGNSGLTRKMKFWNEGGANFTGRLGIGNLPNFFAGSNMLTVNGIADISQALGIGTFNPQTTLDVNGNFRLKKGIGVSNISSNINLSPGDDSTLPTQNAVRQYIKNGSWVPTTGIVPITINPKDFLTNNLSQPQSVFVQGNYAYVASAGNNRLCIYDISNPSTIVSKGAINTNLNSPQSVFVQDNYAYVASAGNSSLCIYDISNPTAIVAKGFISANLNSPQSVFVQGNYAYVASANNNRLCIFDISNVNTILANGFISVNLSSPQSVFVQDSYAYVASLSSNRLSIFDISNSSSITPLGTTNTNLAGPQSVFVQGDYAYVTSGSNGRLCIFDISNPSSIVAKDFINTVSPISVYVHGNLAYVASVNSSTLSVFDINDPNNIVLKASNNAHLLTPQSVFALGDYAYVVSSGNNTLSAYLIGEISGNHTLSLDLGGNVVSIPSLWQTDGTNVFRAIGNIGIGTVTPTAKLQIAGDIKIDGKTLELGVGISKDINAGKIGYQLFTADALDITGAGTSALPRKIKFWNEGGADFTGKVGINGNVGIGAPVNSNRLNVAGNGNIDSLGIGTVDPLNRLTVVGKANIDSLGIGIATPSASFDVNGTALFRGNNTNTIDSPVAGVEFFTGRSSLGALIPGQTNADIAFDYGGTGGGFRHFISTRHNNVTNSLGNGIDFYINNSGSSNGSSAPGTGNVMQLSVTATGVGIGTPVLNSNIKLAVAGSTLLQGTTIMTDTLFVPHIYEEPITLATLSNGWVNNGGGVALVSFYKDREERVYLAGTMRNGNISGGITLFILPAGYRPAASEFFSVHNFNTTAQIRIDPNGVVSLFGVANNNTGLSVSGVSFRAVN